MPRLLPMIAFALLTLASARAGYAQFGLSSEPTADDLVKIELTADVERVVPGRTFHVAVVCRIQRMWHIYWRNPGDSGMPTDISIKAPPGFVVGETRYARPSTYNTPDGINYGYSREVVFLVPVTAPTLLEPGETSFEVDINFLVCKEKCYIGNQTRRLTLPTVFESDADPGQPAEIVAKHLPKMPKPLKALSGAAAAFDGTTLTITGPAGEADGVKFLPVPMLGVNFDDPDASIKNGRFEVTVNVDVDRAASAGKPLSIDGLVALGNRSKDPSYEFSIPLDDSAR